MANVRCSCGRNYTLPDNRLGQRVQCATCKRVFVAVALEAPAAERAPAPKPSRPGPAAGKLRLGELAVARGLLTREALNATLRFMDAVRGLPGQEDLRLGAVLVSKRLLTQAQLDGLLREQGGGRVAAAAAAIDLTARPAKGAGVTEEQREAVRRSMAAAAQQQAEREAAAAEVEAHPGLLARVRRWHVTAASAILAAGIIAWLAWPDPAAKRTLVAYLASCDDKLPGPDLTQVLCDHGLAIREFGNVALLPPTHYDFAEELEAFAQKKGDDWMDFIEQVDMSDEKYNVLCLLLNATPPNALPEELTPRSIGWLRVTEQPATVDMDFCHRGMGMYRQGRHRFLMLKAESPAWDPGWKVGPCEPVAAGQEQRSSSLPQVLNLREVKRWADLLLKFEGQSDTFSGA